MISNKNQVQTKCKTLDAWECRRPFDLCAHNSEDNIYYNNVTNKKLQKSSYLCLLFSRNAAITLALKGGNKK